MGPLAGLKVVEMSAIGPVPLAGMLLADMGADVLIIDKANDPWIMPEDILRRGKRNIEIDMKSEEGVDTTRSLIEKADIVIEGFRPGVMERLGIGPEVFEETNPKLVYGRMTGWGQTGPLSQAAGHDINYIALTGALNAIGRNDSPPVPPLNLVGDYGGGTMFLIMGVLAALHESKTSGKGQVVDAAITEGTANLMTMFYTMSNLGAWTNKRASNMLDSAAHFYDSYETSDAKFITLGAIEPHFYALMKEKMGLSEEDFGQQNDPRKWPELKIKLAAIVATKTQQQWCDIMEGTDVCFAPVLDFIEAPSHHHMQAREAYIEIDGKLQPAPSPKFSRTVSEITQKDGSDNDQAIVEAWCRD
jgi:alpha-methylacyl-CoA racemase